MSMQVDHCECDWRIHEGVPCPNPVNITDGVISSPSLCISCLFVCEGERDDEYACEHRYLVSTRIPVESRTVWGCPECGKNWSVTDAELVADGLPAGLQRLLDKFDEEAFDDGK